MRMRGAAIDSRASQRMRGAGVRLLDEIQLHLVGDDLVDQIVDVCRVRAANFLQNGSHTFAVPFTASDGTGTGQRAIKPAASPMGEITRCQPKTVVRVTRSGNAEIPA